MPLRPDIAVCEKRAAGRTEGAITDYTPYRDLYNDLDDAKQYTIRGDTGDAASMAAQIRKGLNAGKFRIE